MGNLTKTQAFSLTHHNRVEASILVASVRVVDPHSDRTVAEVCFVPQVLRWIFRVSMLVKKRVGEGRGWGEEFFYLSIWIVLFSVELKHQIVISGRDARDAWTTVDMFDNLRF